MAQSCSVPRVSALHCVASAATGPTAPPLPRSPVDMVDAAAAAVLAALAAGHQRQRLDLLLPVNEKEADFMATEADDYPCSLMREYEACCSLTQSLLQRLLPPDARLLLRRIDDGGVEGEPCAVIYPESKASPPLPPCPSPPALPALQHRWGLQVDADMHGLGHDLHTRELSSCMLNDCQ